MAEPTQPVTYSGSAARLGVDQYIALVDRSAHGVLVVDQAAIVRFSNSAAERLLGADPGCLAGSVFGLPLVNTDRAELDRHRPGEPLVTLEMRVAEIEWDGGPAHIVSLRDITPQVEAQAAWREAEGFSRAILESLAGAVAVMDDGGTLLMANEAWLAEGARPAGQSLARLAVGQNFVAACRAAAGPLAAPAARALAGIAQILSGSLAADEFEYPAPAGAAERWCLLRLTPLHDRRRRGVVLWHHDITVQQQAAATAAADRLEADRQASRDRELSSLTRLTNANPTPATAQLYGLLPLRQAWPERFAALAVEYRSLLDESLDRQVFKGQAAGRGLSRDLAHQLGQLHAGPRDVMDLHLATLRVAAATAGAARRQAYAEEGRLLVLELMGHLAAYYRQFAPTLPTSPEADPPAGPAQTDASGRVSPPAGSPGGDPR